MKYLFFFLLRAPRLWYTTVHITTTSTYIFYCWSLITLEWLLQIWNHCSVLFYYAKSVSYYNLWLQIKFLSVTTLIISCLNLSVLTKDQQFIQCQPQGIQFKVTLFTSQNKEIIKMIMYFFHLYTSQ